MPDPNFLQSLLQGANQQVDQSMGAPPSPTATPDQAPAAPATFQTGTSVQGLLTPGSAPPEDPAVLQKRIQDNYKRMEDYVKLLSPDSPQSKQQQQILANTPDKIKKGMLDNYWGLSMRPGELNATSSGTSVPATDEKGNPANAPGNVSLQQGPDVQHRNWFRTIMSTIGEVGRAAAANKGGYAYEDPDTRFSKLANAQYQAATGPIVNQLRYQAEDFRNTSTNLNTDLKTQEALMGEQDRNRVSTQRANALTLLDTVKGRMTQAEEQLYRIRAQFEPEKVQAELTQLGAKTALTQAQTEQTTSGVNKLSGNAAAAHYRENLSPEAQKAYDAVFTKYAQLGETSTIQDVNGVPTRIGVKTGKATPINAVGGVSAPPQQGSAPPQQGPITPKFINGVPVPDKDSAVSFPERQSPSQVYGNRAWAGTPLNNLKNVPPGSTPQNDAVMFAPNEILKAGDKKKVDDASNLYQSGKHFTQVLNTIDPNSFGPVQGNLNKFLQGSVPTDDKLRELYSTGQAIAMAHMGTQNVRNAQTAQRITNEINSWGTTDPEIRATLRGFVNQSGNVFRNHPGSKEQMAPIMGNDYDEIERIYHPDTHSARIQREATAALKARQAATKAVTGVKP